MRSFVAFVFVLVALLLWQPRAHACMNATLSDDPAFVRLREAEDQLEEGDVKRARELAQAIADGAMHSRYTPEITRQRAQRLVAMSWIRDPAASPARIDASIEILEGLAKQENVTFTSLGAELGEGYARVGRDQEAYERLEKLADTDLIASPYTWAAFARVAQKRGEAAKAERARRRCSEITPNASICRGEYPPPPLLRGTPLGYALPGVFVIMALLLRRLVKRPWSRYGDAIFAAMILATCAFVFATPRSPFTATAVTILVLVLTGIAQRLAFVSAVKRERIAGWTLREPTEGDERLPGVASVFHAKPRVLERTPDAGYREPARVAELRLVPRRRGALAFAVACFFVLGLFGACATFTMRSAKSVSSRASDSRLYLE